MGQTQGVSLCNNIRERVWCMSVNNRKWRCEKKLPSEDKTDTGG